MARGLPVRRISSGFLILVADVAVAVSVQVVGVPTAFFTPAHRATSHRNLSHHACVQGNTRCRHYWNLVTWFGITLAYYTVYPVSFYISTAAVAVYTVARVGAYYGLTGVDRESRACTYACCLIRGLLCWYTLACRIDELSIRRKGLRYARCHEG